MLTYMSIQDEIRSVVEQGKLVQLLPIIRSDKVKRHMFVSHDIYEKLQPEIDGESKFDPRFAHLRADLEKFILGGEITVAHDPFKKPKRTFLARVKPVEDEIWDIRSIDPNPAIRVLGSFSEQDVFIALDLEFRSELGGPNDKAWRDFIVRVGAHWRRLFGTYRPLSGDKTSDYISENYLDV
jgi:hypothetical protein